MRFDVEWLDAPGVRDTVLAATWARLRIEAGGQDLTELVHLASDSRRVGVYGPLFPLVEWLIENWWNILYEPPPTSPLILPLTPVDAGLAPIPADSRACSLRRAYGHAFAHEPANRLGLDPNRVINRSERENETRPRRADMEA